MDILPAIGARIHRLRVNGADLVRVAPDLQLHIEDSYFWGSYPMAPWCNRIDAGRTQVAGRELDLPASFPDGTAIHGQVSRVPWAQIGPASFRIQAGGDGWPWPYEVEQGFAFDDREVSFSLRLTNLADEAMPAGLGIHPWFRRPVRVAIRARAVHPSNLVRQGEPVPVTGQLDRRAIEELPDGLDAAWTDLSHPPVSLEWPGIGLAATIEASPTVRYVVAASPANIDAVAVEPETHAPGGIGRLVHGETGALTLLDPGESLRMTLRFVFGRVER
jgi:aldose 1-epimerase